MLDVQPDILHVGRQRPRHQYSNPILAENMVLTQVASTDVGVDRHLGNAGGSGGHVYQVYRGASTFISNVIQGSVAECYVDHVISQSVLDARAPSAGGTFFLPALVPMAHRDGPDRSGSGLSLFSQVLNRVESALRARGTVFEYRSKCFLDAA